MDLLLHKDPDSIGCTPARPVLEFGIKVMLLVGDGLIYVDGELLPGLLPEDTAGLLPAPEEPYLLYSKL